MEQPLVSVIAITRNHSRFCIESLNSILNQTYKNLEWIILDAASTDDTPEIIDNWLVENNVNAIFLKEKQLRPITVNANKALTFSKGVYVQLISLDDVLLKNKIQSQVNCFIKDSSLGMIFGNAKEIDEESNYLGVVFGLNHNKYESENSSEWYKRLSKRNFICAPTVLIDKRLILEMGGFDNNSLYEDWDLWLRLAKKGVNMKFINEHLVNYRRLQTSLSNSKSADTLIGVIYTLKKHNLKRKILISYYGLYFDIRANEKMKLLYFVIKKRYFDLLILFFVLGFIDFIFHKKDS